MEPVMGVFSTDDVWEWCDSCIVGVSVSWMTVQNVVVVGSPDIRNAFDVIVVVKHALTGVRTAFKYTFTGEAWYSTRYSLIDQIRRRMETANAPSF